MPKIINIHSNLPQLCQKYSTRCRYIKQIFQNNCLRSDYSRYKISTASVL